MCIFSDVIRETSRACKELKHFDREPRSEFELSLAPFGLIKANKIMQIPDQDYVVPNVEDNKPKVQDSCWLWKPKLIGVAWKLQRLERLKFKAMRPHSQNQVLVAYVGARIWRKYFQ